MVVDRSVRIGRRPEILLPVRMNHRPVGGKPGTFVRAVIQCRLQQLSGPRQASPDPWALSLFLLRKGNAVTLLFLCPGFFPAHPAVHSFVHTFELRLILRGISIIDHVIFRHFLPAILPALQEAAPNNIRPPA